MQTERRRAERKRLLELSYIQFGGENGGIVWNASEEGLAFHSATPLWECGPVRLCISPNPENRIELSGKIVWTDESKKFGGLQFSETSADIRAQIREWLERSPAAEIANEEFTRPDFGHFEKVVAKDFSTEKVAAEDFSAEKVTTEKAADVDRREERPAAYVPPPRRARGSSVSRGELAGDTTAPFIHALPPGAFVADSAAQKRSLSVSQLRWLDIASTAFLVCVFVGAPVLLFTKFREDTGNSLVRLGEKLKGDSDVRTAAPPSASGQPRTLNENGMTTPNQVRTKAEVPPAGNEEGLSSSAAGAKTRAESNTPETRSAKPQQTGQRSPKDRFGKPRSAAAQMLWSKIGAGDTEAEFALAQLYISGDGVPKNCEQARILLTAASRRGNIEAFRQLQNFRATCH